MIHIPFIFWSTLPFVFLYSFCEKNIKNLGQLKIFRLERPTNPFFAVLWLHSCMINMAWIYFFLEYCITSSRRRANTQIQQRINARFKFHFMNHLGFCYFVDSSTMLVVNNNGGKRTKLRHTHIQKKDIASRSLSL